MERFISADCPDCWTAPDTTRAPPGALALDWVLPGALGDDAPLAAVASKDATFRKESLPASPSIQGTLLSKSFQSGGRRLRVAHGPPLGGYVGTSLAYRGSQAVRGPLTGWLALVERLPAGTEGSPVPRQLVRNLISEPITATPPAGELRAQIWRPMNVPEGARPERLAVVGWVSDARGRVLAVAQSRCVPGR